MTTTTISQKFQIAIPKKIRESMHITSGTKFEIIQFENRIELMPIQPMNKLRGILPKIDTEISREKDRI